MMEPPVAIAAAEQPMTVPRAKPVNRAWKGLLWSEWFAHSQLLLIFLAVGTPDGPDGRADLSQVWAVAEEVGRAMPGYRIVVQKSTCPVGTAHRIKEIIGGLTKHQFDVVSNPEFLKEGTAVTDMMKPDRVVVGCDDVRVLEIMKELYAPFLRTGNPLLSMSVASA